jgi:predicted site-specific integrase-resolvase
MSSSINVDKEFSEELRYFTQAELAQRFRVSPSTIKNWRDQGKLEYFQPDGSSRVLYPRESVEQFERRFTRQARIIERRKQPAEVKKEVHGMSSKPQKEWRI